MKVLVTGVAGRIGRAVAHELLQHGHTVRGLDQSVLHESLRGRVEMVYGNIADRLGLLGAADGCDAVVHLAAVVNPIRDTRLLFETNVSGTEFVLEAAEAHGIERVALASSCCAYGVFFAVQPAEFDYLPVDEEHPSRPQDLYALSKNFNEQAAAAATRRSNLVTVCLRLITVIDLEKESQQQHRWGVTRRLRHSHQHRAGDLWSYIDVHDVARAFRLSIEQPLEGHHVLNCVAPDSLTPCDIRDLVREHYPKLSEFTDRLEADSSLFSGRKAKEVLGFEAEHLWRNLPALKDITPEDRP